jgi:RNA polymerase sigma-70 factor (ECF subfamily)
MAAVKQGDERAYGELMNRHVNSIFNYLFRMGGTHADCEDLTQETFLRVWQKARTYQPGRVKVSTWIHRIAHNLCVDTFRKHRELTNVELPEVAAPGADQFQAHLAARSLEIVEQAIGKLPQSQRSALVLCQIQGFSNADAAEVLGVNVRALESLLARARRQLRTALATGDAAR